MRLSATEKELIGGIQQLGLDDSRLIRDALHQAWCSHVDQTRDDGSSYLEQHVYPVTLSVIDYLGSTALPLTPEVIATALLHDTLEDDEALTEATLERRFGPRVCELVKWLTKESTDRYPADTKEERKRARNKAYYRTLEMAPVEAKIIKILDRINNICWIHTSPDAAKQASYIADTQSFYLPFAHRVSTDLGEMLESALQDARDRCGV